MVFDPTHRALRSYFQNPSAFGMSAFEAGLATLPAAAGMIAITPFITPLAVKIGIRAAIAMGSVSQRSGVRCSRL